MKPGGDRLGVPLKASSARQLFFLEPAHDDFSGEWTQRSLPGPERKKESEGGRDQRGKRNGRTRIGRIKKRSGVERDGRTDKGICSQVGPCELDSRNPHTEN